MAALRAAAKGLRGLSRPASGESGCGRETPSPDEAPSLSGFRGGCCVSPTGNKSLSWRGGAPVFLLLFFPGDRSRSTPWEPGFPSAVNQGDQALSGLPPRSGELNAWPGAGPAAKGPEGAVSPLPHLFRPRTAGIPGYKRARAPTLTLTHTSPEPGLQRDLSGALRGLGSCCREWGRKPSSGSLREAPRA